MYSMNTFQLHYIYSTLALHLNCTCHITFVTFEGEFFHDDTVEMATFREPVRGKEIASFFLNKIFLSRRLQLFFKSHNFSLIIIINYYY